MKNNKAKFAMFVLGALGAMAITKTESSIAPRVTARPTATRLMVVAAGAVALELFGQGAAVLVGKKMNVDPDSLFTD